MCSIIPKRRLIEVRGREMKPKSIIVLTIVLAFALTAMSLNATRPTGNELEYREMVEAGLGMLEARMNIG